MNDKNQWNFKVKSKERTRVTKLGALKVYYGAIITIPSELAEMISDDMKYYYLFEYFDKIIATPVEPPNGTTFFKMRLNPVSKNKKHFTTEVCSKFFDMNTLESIRFTYNSYNYNPVTNVQGRIEVTECGYAPRKHLNHIINVEKGVVEYPRYLLQSNADSSVVLHKELLQYLNPDELYIFHDNNRIVVSSTHPVGKDDVFVTDEANMILDLINNQFVDIMTDKLIFELYLFEKDHTNKQPLITVTT